MEGRKLNIRISAIAGVVAVLILVVVARLYDLQIINGASYYQQSEKKLTRSVEVQAARGEILDRYGRELVTNRICYNISFDSVLFPEARKNELILELVELCIESGVEYVDTLPLEVGADGTVQLAESGDTAINRFERWCEAMEADPSDPQAVFELMADEYGVDPGLTAQQIREVIGIRYELDLRSARIGLNISSYVFAEDIPTELVAVIKERDMPGVNIDTETVREYESSYAAHLLGVVGKIQRGDYEELKDKGYELDDTVGNSGVEKAFEEWLRGKNGRKIEERDTAGKVTGIIYEEEPVAGSNIVLTLDISLQEAAEKSLASRIAEIKALGEAGSSLGSEDVAGGAVVVLDVNTFEILAAASYPTYSLESFYSDYSELANDATLPMYNRAFMGRYQPGSTFKMATAIAALETGAITVNTKITDRGIYTYYAPSYTPMCEIYLTQRGTHGTIDVIDALRVSCNYFFYEVGRLTGIEKMNEYAKLLGLGEPTGVELDESIGILAGKENREAAGKVWNPGDTIQAAIGQSDNLFSPLQLACYVATIANGGTRRSAHILKSIKTYDYSDTIYEEQGEVLSVLGADENNLRAVQEGMLAVSTSGSASAVFRNYQVQVASKTGTAQTGSGSPHGVFVAYAPYDDPQIAVAVVVEHAGKGSRIGVIARDVMDAYFRTDQSLGAIIGDGELVN